MDLPAHSSASERIGWKSIELIYKLLKIIFGARSQFHSTVIFMIIIQGQEMTFTNPVPPDAGVTGRQLILVLIFGTVSTLPRRKQTPSPFIVTCLKQFCDICTCTQSNISIRIYV